MIQFSDSFPFIIAGPCSAESQEQVYSIALELQQKASIQLFRAGIWKPRTRPGSYEGVGEKGLAWLQKIQQELSMPVCIEVATAQHVELALKYGIDVLWIGARTTVNPFSVQEIAEALQGVNIPVMVKNPMYADLQLWIGAIERLKKVGIQEIAAVHRGFFSGNTTVYRYPPMWQIPIELRLQFPDIPIFCDPSHITGNSMLVAEVSQNALDMEMQGLMIEVHNTPTQALSDAKQQITPTALQTLLQELKIKQATIPNTVATQKLHEIRQKIDTIDDTLLQMLATRIELVKQIAIVKQENELTILQLDRWKEIMATRPEKAKEMLIDTNFVKQLFQLIHDDSIYEQLRFMQRNNNP